ncbi:hypothetical protein SBBP2_880001 [Burkholderiales bacterium]|jgi:hypothetical protein|nr:hypothetical protein SBBP2_880001 [Burkholderiales bacterium]
MKLDYLIAAEFASSDSGGKATLVGVFDHLYVKELPAVLSSLSVATRLALESGDIRAEPHKFELVMEHPTGEKLTQIKNEFLAPKPVGQKSGSLDFGSVQLVINLRDPMFPVSGSYVIRLDVDGRTIGTTTIHVGSTANQPKPLSDQSKPTQ